ncbi:threonine synthase [Candidatus Bartonella washoeensis]|nr:threonine synthase [Bartonella washoeensis]
MIILATAHPAKFPDAIQNACGINPPWISCLNGLMECEEHFTSLANDEKIVKNYISLNHMHLIKLRCIDLNHKYSNAFSKRYLACLMES